MSIVKRFLNNISIFNSSQSVTLLGRWEHRLNDNQKKIKFVYNNSDHCGDVICGNPKTVKSILNNEKTYNIKDIKDINNNSVIK